MRSGRALTLQSITRPRSLTLKFMLSLVFVFTPLGCSESNQDETDARKRPEERALVEIRAIRESR